MSTAPKLLRAAPVERIHRHSHGALSLRLHLPEIAGAAAPGHRLHLRLSPHDQLRKAHFIVRRDGDALETLIPPGADALALVAHAHLGTVDTLGPVGTALRPEGHAIRVRCDTTALPFLEFLRHTAPAGSLRVHCEDQPDRWMCEALPEVCALLGGSDDSTHAGDDVHVLAGVRSWIDWQLARGHAGDRGGIVVLTDAALGCGIGMCLTCAIPTPRGYLRACQRGPVLRAAELLP